jgi:hypothetical protein
MRLEAAVPALRGTLLLADGKDHNDVDSVDPQSFTIEGNWFLHGKLQMKKS